MTSTSRTPRPTLSGSWYLDPLVASQKRREFQRLISTATREVVAGAVLKTDLFEEANGSDQLLFDSFPQARLVTGIDINERTVRRARIRAVGTATQILVGDVRDLPFRDGSFDYILSTSTLDHFDRPEEIERSLGELARLLKRGGQILVVLDNPWNPLYPLLRLASRIPTFPFLLGRTLSGARLADALGRCNLVVLGRETVIHNPRLISTLLILLLRRLLGDWANGPIKWLLAVFSWLRHLPSRTITGCFVAVLAEKPDSGGRAEPAVTVSGPQRHFLSGG